MMFQMAACNTLLQTVVDDDKRGRVMSLYVMAFMGTAPFGSLLAGGVADRFGAPIAIQVGGMACLAGAGTFALALPRLRDRPGSQAARRRSSRSPSSSAATVWV